MLIKIIGIAFIGIIASVLVKNLRPEFSVIISIVTGTFILLLIISSVEEVISYFTNISSSVGVNSELITTLLKVVGIGYLTEFSADAAEDSGHKSIANKIVFSGKIIIALLAIPIVAELFELILGII